MAVLPIEKGTENKILRTHSKEVKTIDKKIKKFVNDMIETMFDADGIGIAAPQVGVNLRIFIARLNFDTPHEMIVPMINPVLENFSKKTTNVEEGCLSIPGRFGKVRRSSTVTVHYTDIKGKRVTLHLEGLNARIMQHETDHLDATLIADKMTSSSAAKEGKDE
ncbi:peptide deformylase [Candidatus Peregrinibacteria bacterium CG_4_9_14_0_2_um_filter_53_11]|nr:MAG: peptide deformylase [Candidatus Peregrinibacteria bacterium CG_4_9_14_0_2_um_filter_53_11]